MYLLISDDYRIIINIYCVYYGLQELIKAYQFKIYYASLFLIYYKCVFLNINVIFLQESNNHSLKVIFLSDYDCLLKNILE